MLLTVRVLAGFVTSSFYCLNAAASIVCAVTVFLVFLMTSCTMRACARACVHGCMCACMRACMRACVCATSELTCLPLPSVLILQAVCQHLEHLSSLAPVDGVYTDLVLAAVKAFKVCNMYLLWSEIYYCSPVFVCMSFMHPLPFLTHSPPTRPCN